MNINQIKICDFRNLESLELSLCASANMIYGDNGQGKTNFVEAVWMMTGAKSFRGAKDRELVRFEAPRATVEVEFFAAGRDQTARMVIENRRTASINEIPLKSPIGLAGNLCAVVFSPVHLSLIKNGPQEKRKFIDTSICQIKPKYISVLGQYTRALDQRNRLLKDAGYEKTLFDTLDIWDARLAAYAAVLVKTRATFLQKLLPFARETYAGISGEKELLDFSYSSSLAGELEGDIPSIEKQLLANLQSRRQEDMRARVSLYGPHRDDIDITLDGNSARAYASQGQQRSCVLALKLAECELIRETIGEYPVVLLDDVMSELDLSRRDYLLNHLHDRQLIMTCCDKAYFKTLGRGVGVKLKAGAIVQSRKY